MKLSWNYLQSFFATTLDRTAVLNRLTLAGIEVVELSNVHPNNTNSADVIIDCTITPNRGDCLSYLGIIREIAATAWPNSLDMSESYNQLLRNKISLPTLTTHKCINIALSSHCSSYFAVNITNINNRYNTPRWIVDLLHNSGMKSISPLVDIVNYVMLLTGQPMHVFDAATLDINAISVAFASNAELFKGLDNKEYTLTTDTLVVKSNTSTIAIAGIIGSASSAVSTNTTSILLESAHFTATTLHGKAKYYGIHSEAAFRFERGVDTHGQVHGLMLASEMITQLCNGTVEQYYVPATASVKHHHVISATYDAIIAAIGQHIDYGSIITIIKTIQCVVSDDSDITNLKITPPSFRDDLHNIQDIVEEIIRIYGYERIIASWVATSPMLQQQDNNNYQTIDAQRTQYIKYLKSALSISGFNECISYAFLEDQYLAIFAEMDVIKLKNAIANLNNMRNSLLPCLIKTAVHNISYGHKYLQLFEVGRVFHGESPDKQPHYASGLMYGTPTSWENANQYDFFYLKMIVEKLLSCCNSISFTPTPDDRFIFSAAIKHHESCLGKIGQLQPLLAKQFNLVLPTYLFELDIDSIIAAQSSLHLTPVSYLPKIERDISYLFALNVAAGDVVLNIKNLKIKQLLSIKVVDVYTGTPLLVHQKSISFRLIFQDIIQLDDNQIAHFLHQIDNLITDKHMGKIRQ